MGVKDFRDLVTWQLADELRREVIAFTENESVARDFKFCNQIRDASASACRNTSEGFGRFRPAENARFLEFAHASLSEVQDGLIEAPLDALAQSARRKYKLHEVSARLRPQECQTVGEQATPGQKSENLEP
jgi:four helix bundle protein